MGGETARCSLVCVAGGGDAGSVSGGGMVRWCG